MSLPSAPTNVDLYYAKTGDSVLHVASKAGDLHAISFILTNFDISVDVKNKDDKTPLHEAAQFAKLNSLKMLMKYNPNVNAIKRSDWTPLMLACTKIKDEKTNLEIVKILVENGALIDYKNKDGWSAVHLICRESAPNILQYLIDNKAELSLLTKNGRSALHIACLHQNIDAVNILLKNKVDVNLRDKSGNTPIHEAATSGSIDLIDLLVAHKADVQVRNAADYTILHIAASICKVDTVKHIVANYIMVNVKNKSGITALHCAGKNKNIKVFKYLKSIGAEESEDKFGRTPSNYLNDNK